MFNVLEERPIEPMVYEEIEVVENYHEEQREKQPSQPPSSGVRIRGGESGCNLSVMEVKEEQGKKVVVVCGNVMGIHKVLFIFSFLRLLVN